MLCACIDIGTNTTRVLVAEAREGRLTEVMQRRAFTRMGKGMAGDGAILPEKIAEVAGVVAEQRRLADELGAAHAARGRHGRHPAAPPTATRSSPPCASAAGVDVEILDGDERGAAGLPRRDADARARRSTGGWAWSTSAAARASWRSARSPGA